jgi:hypothetical protein
MLLVPDRVHLSCNDTRTRTFNGFLLSVLRGLLNTDLLRCGQPLQALLLSSPDIPYKSHAFCPAQLE